MKDRLIQVKAGVWYRHADHELDVCCDCGLTHRTEYKLERGMLFMRTYRDERRTARERKALGVKLVKTVK